MQAPFTILANRIPQNRKTRKSPRGRRNALYRLRTPDGEFFAYWHGQTPTFTTDPFSIVNFFAGDVHLHALRLESLGYEVEIVPGTAHQVAYTDYELRQIARQEARAERRLRYAA
jgi:hypothetical protein